MRLAIYVDDHGLDIKDMIQDIPPEIEAKIINVGNLKMDPDGRGNDGFYFKDHVTKEHLFRDIIDFKPDALLTIGRKCFPVDHNALHIYLSHHIPVIIWNVDDPAYTFKPWYELEHPLILELCYDPSHVEWCRKKGIRAFHMPLGTNPNRFKMPEPWAPQPGSDQDYMTNTDPEVRPYSIGFMGTLGDMWLENCHKRMKTLMSTDYERAGVTETLILCARYLDENPTSTIDDAFANACGYPVTYDPQSYPVITAMVDMYLTRRRRVQLVKKLLPLGIQVWGHDDWKQHIPEENFRGYLKRESIHEAYQSCRIVLDIPRFQNPQSYGHRIFDAPLCGAVVMTEYREIESDYFSLSSSIFPYNPRDLDGAFYLAKSLVEDLRGDLGGVARAAQKQILYAHRYSHRFFDIACLLSDIRKKAGLSPIIWGNTTLDSYEGAHYGKEEEHSEVYQEDDQEAIVSDTTQPEEECGPANGHRCEEAGSEEVCDAKEEQVSKETVT